MLPALAFTLAFTPHLAAAGEPYCDVLESCTITSDNCEATTGLLKIDMQPNGKAAIRLNDAAPLESTVLDMNGLIILIFEDGPDQHQLRIQPDGKFTYLISKPDTDAAGGEDKTLYRGQCVEG